MGDGAGFDFCGYQFFQGAKLRISAEGHRRHRQRRARLLEQGASASRLREKMASVVPRGLGRIGGGERRSQGESGWAGCGRLNWRALNAPSEHGLLRAHAPMKEERTP